MSKILNFVVLFIGIMANHSGVEAQTPIVCWSAPQRADALEIANYIANVVDSALKIAIPAFKDPAKRAQYTNTVNQVITALTNGWAAANVCDSIANPIADPLSVIPVYGPLITSIVKGNVKGACEIRKLALGC